jgi:hypothetical protein
VLAGLAVVVHVFSHTVHQMEGAKHESALHAEAEKSAAHPSEHR